MPELSKRPILFTDGTELNTVIFNLVSGSDLNTFVNETGQNASGILTNACIAYWQGGEWHYTFTEKTDRQGNLWKLTCTDKQDHTALTVSIGSVSFTPTSEYSDRRTAIIFRYDENTDTVSIGEITFDNLSYSVGAADTNEGQFIYGMSGVTNFATFTTLDKCNAVNLIGPTSSGFYNFSYVVKIASSRQQIQHYRISAVIAQDVFGFIPISDLKPSTDEQDPFKPGGTSKPGGGNGDWDDRKDPIDIPPLPSTGVVDTGFVGLYNPTLTQVKELATYMWDSSAFDRDAFLKIFGNVMDAIIAFNAYPFNVPNVGARAIRVGNNATPVYANVCSSQYVEIDCGTLTIPEYFGAYLDYSPFTKMELYLPGIGVRSVSADEVIGKPVKIVYHCDVFTGQAICFVKCGESVLYSYECNLALHLPFNASDYSTMMAALVTGGFNAAMNPSASGASSLASTAIDVCFQKQPIQKSGGMGGSSAVIGNKKPYFIITRPNQCVPEEQYNFTGYPTFTTQLIGSCKGYLEVEEVHLDNMAALEDEKIEIENLLKGGVLV